MVTIPTINQLYTAIKADLESEYTITIPVFGKTFLNALAAVQAGRLKLYYLAIANVQKNIFADTAESELIGGTLERFGRVKINRNPFPATAGEYSVDVTGQIGAIIPAQSTFKSDDDSLSPGQLYVLNADYTIVAGPNVITLQALTLGLAGQLSVADTLTITAPVALVDDAGVIASEDVEPVEAETLEDYREKVLLAYRLEPQGGAGADYRLWGLDVQGVAQIYPYAASGIGNENEVNVFVEATIADSTDGKGTPTPAILADVKSSIVDPTVDRPSRKPLTVVAVNEIAVSPKDITIEITGFVGLTPAIETAIFNAMVETLETVRPFVDSIDILANKNDIFDVNKVIAVIIAANPGSIFASVDLKVAAVSVSTFTFSNGDIPFLGVGGITYV